jgi:tRNA (cytidine/uridine-2'-O-)-methyltransferase
VFDVVFVQPEIPGNTGNAIRLAACTGVRLHLVEPLGFTFEDAHLRRAGLDYHDLADLQVHPNLRTCLDGLPGQRVFAFTTDGAISYNELSYQPNDVFLFGRESVGLDQADLAHPRVTTTVRLPMLPGRRSLNLANTAAVVIYEAWRQHGFATG